MPNDYKQLYLDFDQYIRQGEPAQKERAEAWRVAIGLQAVDGLKTSEYLYQTARRNIEGDITIDEAQEIIKSYYLSKKQREPDDDQKREADTVSANITKILSSNTFDFSAGGIASLHRRIFTGVFKHAVKGIDYSPVYLERFFRNLLLGEQWDLRNRYLHIRPSEEWSNQPNLAAPTSTRQVPDKLHTDNPHIIQLITAIGNKQLSVKEMLAALGLKNRENFLDLYLSPAIREGFVTMLYPNSPHHPRQKYLLTTKGMMLLQMLREAK